MPSAGDSRHMGSHPAKNQTPATTTWLTMPRHPDGMPNAAMAQVIEADSAREAAAHFYMDAVVVACHVVTPHDAL